MIIRKLSERRFTTSVNSFRRQLRGLRRAYPRLAANAAHPEMALSMGRMAHGGIRTSPMPAVDRPAAETEGGAGKAAATAFYLGVEHRRTSPFHRAHGHVWRWPASQAARRRRVMLVLIATIVLFFLLGVIPSLRVLWDASLLAFGATAGYLALLIHFHRRAAERQSKVVAIQARGGATHADVLTASHARQSPGRLGTSPAMTDLDDDLLDDAFEAYYDEIIAGRR